MSRMTECADFLALLQQFHDGELHDAEARHATAHFGQRWHCGTHLRAASHLRSALRRAVEVPAPDRLRRRVAALIA